MTAKGRTRRHLSSEARISECSFATMQVTFEAKIEQLAYD